MPQRRKPNALHKQNGTYRPSRHGNFDTNPVPPPLDEVPKPPAYLGAEGRREWNRLLGSLIEMDIVGECDLGMLEIACFFFEQYRELTEYLARDRDEHGKLRRKYALARYLIGKTTQDAMIYTALRQSYSEYARIVYKFGVSPAERSRIHVEREEDPEEEQTGILGVITG
jgi:P27 family predicted phage terminase small subunit